MELKELLEVTKDGLKTELKKAKLLKDDKFNSFKDIFNIPEDAKIYFNNYNIIITDEETLEILKSFLKEENLVLEIKVKQFNCFLWVYDFSNDALFDQLLNEPELEV